MSKFIPIAIDAMEGVTGGKKAPVVTPGMGTGVGSSCSGNNSAVLASIQAIQGSLSDLGKNNNGGLNTTTALCLGMALAARRQSEVRVYGGRGSYYWQSSWG